MYNSYFEYGYYQILLNACIYLMKFEAVLVNFVQPQDEAYIFVMKISVGDASHD